MGKRGPAPTPTPILALRGSWRAKTRPGEPPVVPADIEPPQSLSKPARKIWREVVPTLAAMRVLSDADRRTLVRYCQLSVVYESALAVVEAKGTSYAAQDGDGNLTVKLLPQFDGLMRLSAALLAIERLFGMSPSARAGLVAGPGEADQGHAGGGDKFIGAGL